MHFSLFYEFIALLIFFKISNVKYMGKSTKTLENDLLIR